MALKISHGAFHGSYDQFRAWRNKLAVVAGYLLSQVKDGCCGMVEGVEFEDAMHTDDHKIGNWGIEAEVNGVMDPLVVLLVHSDSEGHILRAQQRVLADRLYELLDPIEKQAAATKKDFDFLCVKITQDFIAALESAYEADEVVMFYNV